MCDLVMVWSSVSDEDEATLETGCEDDLCDGSCSEFQVRSDYRNTRKDTYGRKGHLSELSPQRR